MPVTSDFKLIKEKKLDKDTTLIVKQNLMSGRIFVDFVAASPKITLQKNFPDSLEGNSDSKKFIQSIKNTKDLKKYFGLYDKEKSK